MKFKKKFVLGLSATAALLFVFMQVPMAYIQELSIRYNPTWEATIIDTVVSARIFCFVMAVTAFLTFRYGLYCD